MYRPHPTPFCKVLTEYVWRVLQGGVGVQVGPTYEPTDRERLSAPSHLSPTPLEEDTQPSLQAGTLRTHGVPTSQRRLLSPGSRMWTTYEDVNGKTQVCRVGFWGDEYELLKVPSVRPSPLTVARAVWTCGRGSERALGC